MAAGDRTLRPFIIGDRVKRSDADAPGMIPAYRDMRGTVTGFDWTRVLVKWDCDGDMSPTPTFPETITRVAELPSFRCHTNGATTTVFTDGKIYPAVAKQGDRGFIIRDDANRYRFVLKGEADEEGKRSPHLVIPVKDYYPSQVVVGWFEEVLP